MLLDRPHHDPSERHVSDPTPALDDLVTVEVEVPPGAGVERVLVRTVHDGEVRWIEAHSGPDGSWRADLRCHNPDTRYRFWLQGRRGAYWLTGLGPVHHDPADHFDFRLLTTGGAPDWVPATVWYQVFPDRFASSGRHHHDLPDWAWPSRWSEPVAEGPRAMTQVYGGDLDGVVERIDHLVALGIGGVYLTPFFPARSSHRYDAATFATVDPLLGGDAALVRLRDACRRAGLRLIGDLTLNHTGDHHDWFQAARADAASVEAGFYHFIDHPDRYASWLDVPSLPVLDHGSPELRRRLYDGSDSILARYLQPPFGLDGWRIDVANMTGRRGRHDHNRLARAAARRTAGTIGGDRWLVAEHFADPSPDADADGWHGFMSYAGVGRPVASWLGRPDLLAHLTGGPGQVPRDGPAVARAMDEARASMPWQVVLGSMALIGSHDTPRWHSLAADPARARIGAGLLFTLPGSPCLLYGDEIGLTGSHAEAARCPMPWEPSRWDRSTLAWYRELIGLRRRSPALAHGGFRWVEQADDALAFLRRSRHERLLVRAVRASGAAPLTVPHHLLGVGEAELVAGEGTLQRRDGALVFGADGPAFAVWRLSP